MLARFFESAMDATTRIVNAASRMMRPLRPLPMFQGIRFIPVSLLLVCGLDDLPVVVVLQLGVHGPRGCAGARGRPSAAAEGSRNQQGRKHLLNKGIHGIIRLCFSGAIRDLFAKLTPPPAGGFGRILL
jgi:hypothetical protein